VLINRSVILNGIERVLTLPNQLTLLRIFLTPLFVILLFSERPIFKIALLIVFVVASLTDWYDGYAARRFGYVTKWGQFLDPLADKIFVNAGLISFSVLGYINVWLVMVIFIRDLFITGLRLYGIVKQKPFATNLFAKMKTVLQFMLLCFIVLVHFLVFPDVAKITNPIVQKWSLHDLFFFLLCLVTLLTVISGCVYLIENKSRFKELVGDICRIFKSLNV
jgi:CDP-diacylglycerol--glycerol-3-phosphate 3-phosphatidyltransferase